MHVNSPVHVAILAKMHPAQWVIYTKNCLLTEKIIPVTVANFLPMFRLNDSVVIRAIVGKSFPISS